MNIFSLLKNSIFEGCNTEAYSYWIKKRVTVFEYGKSGKIKLGIEPFEEEGSLTYCDSKECGLYQLTNGVIDALFIYHRINEPQFKLTAVIAKEQILDLDVSFCQKLKEVFNLPPKLIIATDSEVSSQLLEFLNGLCERVLVVPYSQYHGRELEDFIKD